MSVGIDRVGVRSKGQKALYALELPVYYSEVKWGAVEDVLVVYVQSELPLREHH